VTSVARPIAVLVTGEPIQAVRVERGEYADIIRGTLGAAWPDPIVSYDVRTDVPLPDPNDVSGFVITGSSASVTERAPWMLRTEEYLRAVVAARVPVFGICFGHQMLAQALGGSVARNRRGREIGTVAIETVADDALWDSERPPFRANATHVDTVDVLPPGAVVLARSELEPHAALRFSDNAWGVQFHPEMDGAIIREYLRARRDLLAREGLDPAGLLSNAADTPVSAGLLRRFAELIRPPR
jgi:GMP synthase (glutamine-hydrolysing)